LNANGKLLSSPVASKPDDKSKKKKDKRRGKSGVEKDGSDRSKVVTIKYTTNKGEAGASLGKLVDDIINGRKKHNPRLKHQKPIRPAAKKDEPAKPTHPFFMKKSTRKADTLQPQGDSQNSTTLNAEQERDTRAPLSSDKPLIVKSGTSVTNAFTPIRQRASKFPETVHPVWPPRDFTHVRGIQAESHNDFQSPMNVDRKKAKMAAIRVQDNESVLSPELQGLCQGIPKVLRIPERHIASGHILQRAIAGQLSQSTLPNPDSYTLDHMCHPAIARLYSSIPSSLTAFDRGEYENCLWSQKYAPTSAGHVLQTTKEASMLRDWLRFLMVSAVDTGKAFKDGEAKRSQDKKKRKKRKKTENLDGFIVSSADEASELGEVDESEDELAGGITVSSKRTVIRSGDLSLEKGRVSNVILLSGPSGCGKTASVYAAAKELDFEVFEINAGNRRSARDIVERVGDMTRNHLVHTVGGGEEKSDRQSSDRDSLNTETENPKQNKLMGFFKSTPANVTKNNKAEREVAEKQTGQKRSRSQKQSFILLEEADLLFEEDKQFWSGVLTLINQSKRPIIITCNDERLIPLEDLSFHAILRYRPPPQHLAIDYLLLLAANEGHMLKREAISDLYTSTGKDLRRAITELNFWCQMAIGSEKSGLDWMIDRWPRGSDVDDDGHPLRVISVNSYEPFMGWFSRDMLVSNSLESMVESQREAFSWWGVSLQDAESMMDLNGVTHCSPTTSKLERLDILQHQSDLMDMRSALDVLSFDCSLDFKLVSFRDGTVPLHLG
jgi:sorting nexin-8